MMVSAGRTSFSNGKTEVLARIMRQAQGQTPGRLLVVGCGSGEEAAILAQELGCEVIGVDLTSQFDPRAAAVADLRHGDATQLAFADGEFDYVYSFHALEHIKDYRLALREMRRVLAPGGGFCIGTPNRQRLVGYLGSHQATHMNKILWNLHDWKARLAGRFRNEYGAHAGFSRDELAHELRQIFGTVVDVGSAYYLGVYPRHAKLIRLLGSAGLDRYLFPSVYFVGRA
jgi:ubiquinone/menaquinone biosynthesis C-methylase UbiE